MKTIRWVTVLPLSFVLAILIDFPLHFILYRSFKYFEALIFLESTERTIAPFFRGISFVVIGYYLAPTGKLLLSKIFSWIWIICAIIFFMIYGEFSHLLTYIAVGLGILGAFIGVFITKRLDNNKKPSNYYFGLEGREKIAIPTKKLTCEERQKHLDIVNNPKSSYFENLDSKLLIAIDDENNSAINEVLDELENLNAKIGGNIT